MEFKLQDRLQEDIEDEINIVIYTLKNLQRGRPSALKEFIDSFSPWKRNDIKKCSKNRKSTPSRLRAFWAELCFEPYF
ncbi:hypothetical protein [Oscillibacter sp.]|uniref:hypothetical protein n=1 Tax=Oscillibacter sp. TaxID=1945593 RepID=UPI002D803299|nr:hypothetical protein [Oscillibacter sp.]